MNGITSPKWLLKVLVCLVLFSTLSYSERMADQRIYESCKPISKYLDIVYVGDNDICRCICKYAAEDWPKKYSCEEIKKMSDVEVVLKLSEKLKDKKYQ